MNNLGWLNDIDDKLKNYVKTSVECVKGAYDTGYKNGKNEAYKSSVGLQDARQNGREEAWEMARKLVLAESKGGLSGDKLVAIFGMANEFEVLEKCSIGQVLEAYEGYKDKKNSGEIEVRDEVLCTSGSRNFRLVVLKINDPDEKIGEKSTSFEGVDSDGNTYCDVVLTDNWKKTGRKFALDFLKK